MKKISQALISVSDKRNLKKILSVLKKFKIKIISAITHGILIKQHMAFKSK